jgi:hypothetical protein
MIGARCYQAEEGGGPGAIVPGVAVGVRQAG